MYVDGSTGLTMFEGFVILSEVASCVNKDFASVGAAVMSATFDVTSAGLGMLSVPRISIAWNAKVASANAGVSTPAGRPLVKGESGSSCGSTRTFALIVVPSQRWGNDMIVSLVGDGGILFFLFQNESTESQDVSLFSCQVSSNSK